MATSPILLVEADIVGAGRRQWQCFSCGGPIKKKGLQLALEPLNGRGIAGYVPKPQFWARSHREIAPREKGYML
jgi:hypothetical protein